jgi:hypothetical protein
MSVAFLVGAILCAVSSAQELSSPAIEIRGLRSEYTTGAHINFSIRNTSKQSLLVNVVMRKLGPGKEMPVSFDPSLETPEEKSLRQHGVMIRPRPSAEAETRLRVQIFAEHERQQWTLRPKDPKAVFSAPFVIRELKVAR